MAGRYSFVTEKEVQKVREDTVPENTKKHTLWSTNAYKQWAWNNEFVDFRHESKAFSLVPGLKNLTINEMNYWLSRFAVEIRRGDGNAYRHEVLYGLFCGVNRVIREN
jgi:hypothetical protein